MPLDYKEYHPKWSLISRLIRFRRAQNKCEWCGVANYTIRRKNTDTGKDELPCGNIWLDSVAERGCSTYQEAKQLADHWNWLEDGIGKWNVIVLTVAHVDHDKTNNVFSNLAALCQRCHLNHDLTHHINNRRWGRNWKRNQLFLWNK
jgi:hypothetical protein